MTNVSQYILHTKPATFQVEEGLLDTGEPIEDENALQAAIDSFNAIAAKYYNDTLTASKAAQAAADAAAKSAASLKTDTTLTLSGYAADAKTVGDKLAGKAESSEVTSIRNDLQSEIDRATDTENQLKEDIDDLSNALKIVTPVIRNGSLGNPGNANAVSMKYSMPWGKSKRAVVTMVSSPKGCTKYEWVYRTYSEGNVETQSTSKIIELDPYLFTTENHVIIENLEDKAFGVSVLCHDAQDALIPLRINSIGSDCFKIELVDEEPVALVPSVLNGSLGNPNNEFYVRVGEVIPIPKDFTYIQFDFDDYGLGLDFIFDLWTYNETGIPGTKYSSRIQEISDLSKNYVSKSQISAEAKSYCITVTATRNGEKYALRSENIFDFIRIKYILYPESEIAQVNNRISAAEKDLGDLTDTLKIVTPEIRNGSLGNTGNANAVAMKNSIAWGNSVRAIVTMTNSPSNCVKFGWVYRAYNEENIASQSQQTIDLDPYLFTTDNQLIVDAVGDKAFAIGVFCYDSNGDYIPLRVNNIGTDCFKVTFSKEKPTELIASVANGSLGNPNNLNSVRIGEVIPVPDNVSYIVFDCDDYGLGLNFRYTVWTYNETNIPSSKYSSRIQEILISDKNYISKSQISAEAKSYAISIEATKNDDVYPLRSIDMLDFIRLKYVMCPEQEINQIDAKVNKVEEDIVNISNGIKADATQLNRSLSQSRFGDCITLLHFSDIHADKNALKQISEAIDNYDSNIDGSICTGDIVANSYGSISSWWNNKIMTCIGNHDSASYSSGTYDWTYLPMSERSALYIEPFEAFWGVNHEQGTSYYYKDFTNKKVRLIVIDTMLYMSDSTSSEASAQTVWLQTLLNTAKENGYHVIIATHAPNGLAKSMECSFSKYHTSERVMPIEKDCTLPNSIVDTVKTAIDGGLHFVGYICGHTHQDDIWVCAGDSRQLMYCIATSNVENINQWKDTDLWHGENCNAYNLVTINTSTKTLCLIRGGGANADKFVRERKMICFDYANAKLIR